jgi:hypothetical protein
MSKIKIKQIHSEGQPAGAVLTTNGSGENSWVVPEIASGSETLLGIAEDGSYVASRYDGGRPPAAFLEPTTKVSTAIDSINEILGLLLPTAPANLSTGTLALSTANTSARAAQGYNTNSLSNAPAAGSLVSRITLATASTTILQDLGPGNEGTISLFAQGVAGETFSFTENIGDSKTTGLLRITDNKWGGFATGGGPAPDGFFQTFDSQVVSAPAVVGLNQLQFRHTAGGNTNVLAFVRDDLTASPAVSVVTAVQGSKVGRFVSGIEHYDAASTLLISGNATNLAGQTYTNGTILSLSAPFGSTVNFAAGAGGLPSVLSTNTLSFDLTSQTFTVGGTHATKTGKVTLTATNPNGSGNAQSAGNLLVWTGNTGVSDTAITARTTTATRVVLTTNNVDTPNSLVNTAWSNTASLAGGSNYEAATVGGVVSCDQTNYSTGYLPAGNPDYSSKPSTQYVTYRFSLAALSSITVNITGTYAGMWVALPNVSDNPAVSPAAINGVWWNAGALYSGSGAPGKAGDTAAGCANGSVASGTTGSTVITFGTTSSSSATGNFVYVRVKLNAGQSISAISIS